MSIEKLIKEEEEEEGMISGFFRGNGVFILFVVTTLFLFLFLFIW